MPSCAKLEKRASAEVVPVDNNTPIRQVIVAVEHKIRNLEKRKGKLESYRDLQKSGKDLTPDQKIAVSKYDEVTQCLDFAKELFKQVHAISAMWEKDQKKVVRKETANRIQSEVTKVKEVLVIQDTLESLRDEQAREDFLTGSNGAAKLEQKELELLDKLYVSSSVKRVPGSNLETYLASAQKAADHLISTVDGKPKSFCDTNYERIRNILQVVQNSGYFDKQFTGEDNKAPAGDEVLVVVRNESDAGELGETVKNGVETPPEVEMEPEEVKPMTCPQQPAQIIAPTTPTFPAIAEQLAQTPIVSPMLIQQQPTIIPSPVTVTATPPLVAMTGAPSPLMPNPEHMRAMEQNYYKQHQQYLHQMRPINEIIAGSAYYFFQDSELDSPDVVVTTAPVQGPPQQPVTVVASTPIVHTPAVPPLPIATQTFTNQNFSTVMVPQPPPVAAPPAVAVFPGMKPPVSAPLVPPPEHLSTAHIPGFTTAPRPIVPTPNPTPGSGHISPAQQIPPTQYPIENLMMQQQPVNVPPVEKSLPQRKIEEPATEEPPLTITEWNPEESGAVTAKKKPEESSTNWADQAEQVNESGSNSDNQFGGSWQAEGTTSSGGGYSGRRGYGGSNHMRRRGHGNSMGYRSSRQGNGGGSYQNGGGNRSGGTSTFYRNNDPNYYQNQNGGGASSAGGGGGGYHNESGGSTYKPRSSNMRSNMGRSDRSHSNRRENRSMRSTGGYTGPTRTSAGAQND
ncbi:hypothetical protein DMENIID0001_022460 [Sergentomyia squamirostris]